MGSRPASGLSMILIGVWLVAQAVGGDLGGRVRAAAAPRVGKVSGATGVTDPALVELMKASKQRVP